MLSSGAMTLDLATTLSDRVRGRVIVPRDSDYDEARSVFNGMLDHRPRLIARPVDAADVASVVRWANDADLPLAVRGGGHSVAGHQHARRRRRHRSLRHAPRVGRPRPRTATAMGGCLLVDLDMATAAHGCAVPSGTFVDTGAAGLTLSGGIGYLVASEGFACDALVGAELVTADGTIVDVDGDREPDLLWALRGGGGNFGVVTSLRYRLTTVEQVFGGRLRFRGDGVADALERVFELERAAPDELSLQAVCWRSAETDGAGLTAIVALARRRSHGQSRARLAARSPCALRGWRCSRCHGSRRQASSTPIPFGMRHYWKGHFVRDDDGGAGHRHRRGGGGGGRVRRCPRRAHPRRGPSDPARRRPSADAQRVANVTALAIWSDPADDAEHVAWARTAAAAFEPFSLTGAGYLNYAETDQTAARVAAAFGRRLRAAAADQARRRPEQPLPVQREHPASLTPVSGRGRRGRQTGLVRVRRCYPRPPMTHVFISPHPDDAALSCGGLIASLRELGPERGPSLGLLGRPPRGRR